MVKFVTIHNQEWSKIQNLFFFFLLSPIQEFYCLFIHFVDCSAALPLWMRISSLIW
jgi:hypothetical protein